MGRGRILTDAQYREREEMRKEYRKFYPNDKHPTRSAEDMKAKIEAKKARPVYVRRQTSLHLTDEQWAWLNKQCATGRSRGSVLRALIDRAKDEL